MVVDSNIERLICTKQGVKLAVDDDDERHERRLCFILIIESSETVKIP